MASEYLKFFHLIFAFLLIAGITLAVYGVQRAARSKHPEEFQSHLQASRIGGIMASVGVITAILFGVLTAWKQGLPLTSTGWLNAAYGSVFIAGVVIPMLFDMPAARKARALMPAAIERGEVLPEQVRLIDGSIPG